MNAPTASARSARGFAERREIDLRDGGAEVGDQPKRGIEGGFGAAIAEEDAVRGARDCNTQGRRKALERI